MSGFVVTSVLETVHEAAAGGWSNFVGFPTGINATNAFEKVGAQRIDYE